MEQINFQQTIERLKDTGFSPIPNVVQVTVPDAKRVLWAGIRYFTGENARWLPEYEEVAGWPAMKVVDFCVSATADAERPLSAERFFLWFLTITAARW